LERWLLAVWYGDKRWGKYLLLPLTIIFCLLSTLRRWRDKRQQVKHPVPVVVVGNLTAGGTGKTPLVIWLVEQARVLGFRPGVVSRGYQRQGHALGDEPTLIQQRTQVPLVVGRERNQAIQQLLHYHHCDLVIADDGLQHYRMGRALEICVVDGQRRFGNGWCIPSGPLREPIKRLRHCDVVIVNGTDMSMHGDTLVNLATAAQQPLSQFAGQMVHVVTGIGNPQRFYQKLQQAGLRIVPHLFPDHHVFRAADLQFGDPQPILMTEKDAVKCREFATPQHWYLPVAAVLTSAMTQTLLTRLGNLRHG
ncbi:MAG: tetraacyldisaccharide 4'-kinase, partial [Thiothrix sp.]